MLPWRAGLLLIALLFWAAPLRAESERGSIRNNANGVLAVLGLSIVPSETASAITIKTDGEDDAPSFRRPAWFTAVGRECRAVSESAGIIDLSGFAKYRVRGRDAHAYLDRLSANRLPRRPGEMRLCHCLNHRAAIECELTITRAPGEGAPEYYLIGAAIADQHHLDWLEANRPRDLDVSVERCTRSIGVLGLCGPRSRETLASLTPSIAAASRALRYSLSLSRGKWPATFGRALGKASAMGSGAGSEAWSEGTAAMSTLQVVHHDGLDALSQG